MQIATIGLHKPNVPGLTWPQDDSDHSFVNASNKTFDALDIPGEILFISSTHSIEVFLVSDQVEPFYKSIEQKLLDILHYQKSADKLTFHTLKGPDAVRHFFQLSIGLEAFIEKKQNDFLENARASIHSINDAGKPSPILNRLYQTALMLEARMKQSGLSFDYSFVANRVQTLIEKIFGPLRSVKLLMVGSNDLAHPILDSMPARKLGKLQFADQSVESAALLADTYKGQVIDQVEIDQMLTDVQVILRMNQDFSNRFTEPNLQSVMTERKNQSLLIINLDTTLELIPAVHKIYNLFVYDLADFQPKSSQNGIGLAQQMIEDELKQFFSWFYSKERYRFGNIIGKSKSIERILELIARISQTSITVLIQGESGTGKELIAQAIHENSPRRNNPFIVVNCGALTETLLESELFGHVKGAFTGATYTKKGLLEEADGGTLMLDEIGDTSQAFQVKLLRVLQQGEMRKVGSNETLHINVRIIAATNKNLVKLVEQEKFRSDLYYRINVVQVDLPPLAERVEDIPLLAEHFISQYSKEMKKRITGLSPETRQLVLDYPWPGNVRELENAMERAVALAIGHTILPEDLPPNVRQFKQNQNLIDAQPIKPLKSLEKEHIIHALTRYNWDYDRVAQKLGIGRTTLWRKMKDYGISKTAQ